MSYATAVSARVTAAAESLNGRIIALVTIVASTIASFGIINSTEEGAFILGSTTILSIVGLVTHALHSGKINPSGLVTYVGTLLAQVGVLAVSFGIWGLNTQTAIVNVASTLVLAAVQIAHTLWSKQVE